MKFSDLLQLPFDSYTNKIPIELLRDCLPSTPESVLVQVFHEHGRNQELHSHFGSMDLSTITWSEQKLPGAQIADCWVKPESLSWVNTAASRVQLFHAQGWHCIDYRKIIAKHWEINGTWQLAPVLLFIAPESALILLEGHTRIGILRGLISNGIIDAVALHDVFVGRCDA